MLKHAVAEVDDVRTLKLLLESTIRIVFGSKHDVLVASLCCRFCSTSVISLGLMNLIAGKVKKLAYFKPVCNKVGPNGMDPQIETVLNQFGLDLDYRDTYAFT